MNFLHSPLEEMRLKVYLSILKEQSTFQEMFLWQFFILFTR